MDLTTKDAILVVLGVAGGFIANALWAWWSVRSQRSRESLRAEEDLWRASLNHEGYIVRAEAASEILVRAIYWLVLGNVLFAVTGLMSVLNAIGIYELHLAVTEMTFLLALVFLANSLKWLRRYLRLKEPVHARSQGAAGRGGAVDPSNPPSRLPPA
jgi:hypothetical protein